MSKLLYQGHSSCAGCPETIAIRNILNVAGPNTIISNVTGCVEIVSSGYPTTSWAVPYLHAAFETGASAASGIEAALNQLGKEANIIVIAGDGACYSDDTEIFTEEGFKNIKDINIGEKLWSVNPDTNELELATNEKLHKYKYKGKMIRGKSKFIDFLITPNHNVPIWYKGKWKFIKGHELKKRYKTTFIRKFEWNCKTLETITIPKIETHTCQKVFNQFPARP